MAFVIGMWESYKIPLSTAAFAALLSAGRCAPLLTDQ